MFASFVESPSSKERAVGAITSVRTMLLDGLSRPSTRGHGRVRQVTTRQTAGVLSDRLRTQCARLEEDTRCRGFAQNCRASPSSAQGLRKPWLDATQVHLARESGKRKPGAVSQTPEVVSRRRTPDQRSVMMRDTVNSGPSKGGSLPARA